MPTAPSRRNSKQSPPSVKPIAVLIVDDSALVRRALEDILGSDSRFVVQYAAADPFEAARVIAKQVPDVMVLDIEMPRMNGLTFLKKVMRQHPIPTVICSTVAEHGSQAALEALRIGAVDVIHKPRLASNSDAEQAIASLKQSVFSAAHANVMKLRGFDAQHDFEAARVVTNPPLHTTKVTKSLIALGASTGGTDALLYVLSRLPSYCADIVVTQHMPEVFTASFARYLDQHCELQVSEAKSGEFVLPGRVLVAPGNRHMIVRGVAAPYQVHLHDGPAVRRHRPSVDELFLSVAQSVGADAVGVIMTGMGEDGARGLLAMKGAGAWTIAQDEASSVVFGMPRRAIELGGASEVLGLDDIPKALRRVQVRVNVPT